MTAPVPAGFSGPIWEGVYQDFAEVPSRGDGFKTSDWLESSRLRLDGIREAGCRYQEYLLPAIASVISAEREKSPLIVVDVGGGPGNGYPPLRAAIPSGAIDFHVVENTEVCTIGREAFSDNSELTFHNEIPELSFVNIIHLGSVIQYVDDWKSFLGKTIRLNPEYLLFSDAFVGPIPTFITAQNFYGMKLPCRFLSINELVGFVKGQGFRLVLDTEYDRTMLGKRDPLPLEALPEPFRLRYTHHLLFRRSEPV